MAPARDAHHDCRHGKEEQRKEVAQVFVTIETRYGLAHGVVRVGDGQPGIDGLEEGRHHLDGIHARGAGHLQNDEKEEESVAKVPKGHREHVADVHEDKRCHDRSQIEGKGIQTLNAQEQVARAAGDGRQGAEQGKEAASSEVTLPGAHVVDSLVIGLQLEDGDIGDGANPHSDVREEGGDARAIVLHGIEGLLVHRHRRREELTHLLGIGRRQVVEQLQRLRSTDDLKVSRKAAKGVVELAKGRARRGERTLGLLERIRKLVRDVHRLRDGGIDHLRSRLQLLAHGDKGIEREVNLRQVVTHGLGLRVMQGAGRVLHLAVHVLGEPLHLVGSVLELLGNAAQLIELGCLRVRDLDEKRALLAQLLFENNLGLLCTLVAVFGLKGPNHFKRLVQAGHHGFVIRQVVLQLSYGRGNLRLRVGNIARESGNVLGRLRGERRGTRCRIAQTMGDVNHKAARLGTRRIEVVEGTTDGVARLAPLALQGIELVGSVLDRALCVGEFLRIGVELSINVVEHGTRFLERSRDAVCTRFGPLGELACRA